MRYLVWLFRERGGMMVKNKFNTPQLIMAAYLIVLFLCLIYLGIDCAAILNESLVKMVMNGVFVLALIPMINTGVGMNFGLPIGISAGLIGMLISIQFRLTGFLGFIMAIAVGSIAAIIFGYLYALLLNKLKGNEEIIGMFAGFAFIPIMNMFYSIAPFTNRQMLYPIGGNGLRPKINLENYFKDILDNFMVINIGKISIPLGMLVFYSIICIAILLLFKSKLGVAMKAIAENEGFAKLSGININKTRTISVIVSMIIAAMGICVYSQSYGFVQLYDSPLTMAFPAVSAILIGGATRKRATVLNAIIGTYLFQTTFLISVPVANELLIPQMSEITRMIITNGILLYAFLYEGRSKKNEIF